MNTRRNSEAHETGVKCLLGIMGLLSLPLLSGCHPQGELDYVPMAVGATWEYRMETSEERGGKEKQVRSGTVVRRCVGSERIAGKDYLKCMSFYQGFPDMSEFASWQRRGADGVHQIVLKKENPERLAVPLPLKVGRSWTTEESQAKAVGLIEGVETVDLPERSYPNCFKLKFENYDKQGRLLNKSTFWLAGGIGVVKGETESEAGGSRTKQWLTRYTVSP
jgi:hypothetical protein